MKETIFIMDVTATDENTPVVPVAYKPISSIVCLIIWPRSYYSSNKSELVFYRSKGLNG